MGSIKYIYNQIKLGGCTSGSSMTDALNMVLKQGDCSFELMPYDPNACSTQPNTSQKYDASKNNILQWYSLNPSDVSSIKKALDMGYPVPVGFVAHQSFYQMWSTTGIWNNNFGVIKGGHATCIIGYDDTKQMFKVQNSWGLTGGDPGNPGFYWIPYSFIQQSCLSEAYVIVSVNSSYPETYSGSTLLCNSGTEYSINNVPTGYTVSWNYNGNLILNSHSGNVANFSSLSNSPSSGFIQATLVGPDGSFTIPQFNVWLGVPVVNYVTDQNGRYFGETPECTFKEIECIPDISNLSNTTSCTWSISPTVFANEIWNTGLQGWIYLSTSGYYYVSVQSANACGAGPIFTSTIIGTPCSSSSYSLSPNPASSNVTLTRTLVADTSASATPVLNSTLISSSANSSPSCSVKIMNNRGATYYEGKCNGNTFTIPVSNLPNGTYWVEITEGNHIVTKQLVVKH